MMPPRLPLSGHGGQYVLLLKWGHCDHQREAHPETFARIAGCEAARQRDRSATLF
jgi:hypothetical protein